MKKITFFLCCLLAFSTSPLLAEVTLSNPESESEEEQAAEPASSSSPLKGLASGVKQVAYEGPKEFAKETVSQAPKKPPIVAIVEGVNTGTQRLLDHTVKGAYKVATLGVGEFDSYEVEEPEKGSGEPTKIKISLPGT